MNCNNHKTDKDCNTVYRLGQAGQRGRAGDRGPIGETGAQGPQGNTGEDGVQVLNMAVIYDDFDASEPPARLVLLDNSNYAVNFGGGHIYTTTGAAPITHSGTDIGLPSGYYLISYNLTIGAFSNEIVDEIYRFELFIDTVGIPSSRQAQNISPTELNQAKSISGTCVVLSTAASEDTTPLRLELLAPNDPNVIDNLAIYSASLTIWRIQDAPIPV